MNCIRCGEPLGIDYMLFQTAWLNNDDWEPDCYCTEQCLIFNLLETLELPARLQRRVARSLTRRGWPVRASLPEESPVGVNP